MISLNAPASQNKFKGAASQYAAYGTITGYKKPLKADSFNAQLKPVSASSVRFAGGGGGDPFTAAYALGGLINDIVNNNPVNPLSSIVMMAGNGFNLYHVNKVDKTLEEIKEKVSILQDAHLERGVEMLDSSLEAASLQKENTAHRDLGFAKDAFATAARTATSLEKQALAYEYLAQTYQLDGMSKKALEARKEALKKLNEHVIDVRLTIEERNPFEVKRTDGPVADITKTLLGVAIGLPLFPVYAAASYANTQQGKPKVEEAKNQFITYRRKHFQGLNWEPMDSVPSSLATYGQETITGG